MTRKYANAKSWSPDYPHWLKFNYFNDVPYPASAAAVTSIGAITAGTGFTSLATITVAPSGGTLTAGVSPADPAVVVPTSLKSISATVVAPGTGVAIGDTFNPVGGTVVPAGPYGTSTTTAGVASKYTVANIQVVSAIVNAVGSGGTPGAVTLVGTTGTGTKWQGTSTITAGGTLTAGAVVTITIVGNYTATPTIAGDTITGGSLTGATVTLIMGAAATVALTNTTAGSYSVAPPLTACPLTGAGTGTGTGVTATLVYGLGAAIVAHSGNYSGAPSFTVTDSAAGTGASIATATLGGSGAAIPRFVSDGTLLPVNSTTGLPSYGVHVGSNITALASAVTVQKTVNGFTVAVAGSTTLAAGTFDAFSFA
jgi:hypothetical protein